MARHLLNGNPFRTMRKAILPILCLCTTLIALPAQGELSPSPTADPDSSSTPGAANPAPEPDTAMLLGTGAVVLLVLYTRKRTRVIAPSRAQQ